MTTLSQIVEPNRCVWNYSSSKTRCDHSITWVVKSNLNEFGACHTHLEGVCRWMANEAPLTVQPVFSNWSGLEHLSDLTE